MSAGLSRGNRSEGGQNLSGEEAEEDEDEEKNRATGLSASLSSLLCCEMGETSGGGAGTMRAALEAAWGLAPAARDEDEDGVAVERDFGPAWRHLASHPEGVNETNEDGRTLLHCCVLLPDDPGRAVLINNLLALGADIRARDKDGWSPSQSDFVLEAEARWLNWKHRLAHDRDLSFLLSRATPRLTLRRAQQAIWLCMNRRNTNTRFFDKGLRVDGQTPLHLVARCIPAPGGDEGDASADSPAGGEDHGGGADLLLRAITEEAARPRLVKWSAKKALLRLRKKAASAATTEPWTSAHDLLCLLLDLGADAELADAEGRRPSDYCASPTVRDLLSSDWELGEYSKQGVVIDRDNDAVIDAATGRVLGTGKKDDGDGGDGGDGDGGGEEEALRAAFAGMSVRPADCEDEGLYARVERAEREAKEWRKGWNGRAMAQDLRRWCAEDAVANLAEWGAEEGHPANRRRVGVAMERKAVGEMEEEEREEYELEYEFV